MAKKIEPEIEESEIEESEESESEEPSKEDLLNDIAARAAKIKGKQPREIRGMSESTAAQLHEDLQAFNAKAGLLEGLIGGAGKKTAKKKGAGFLSFLDEMFSDDD